MRRGLKLVLPALLLLAVAVPVAAKGPGGIGSDPTVGKQLWKFNVIATPKNSWTGTETCANNGSRIFFQRGNGNTIGQIAWQLNPDANQDFKILDCDGTKDAYAIVEADEKINFWVTVRLLGPKSSNLSLTCQNVVEDGSGNDLCILGAFNPARGATTKIMSNIFDDEYEEVLWTLSGDWRIIDVRVWEKL